MGFVPFTFVDLIDIILVAVIMYWIYRMTKGTNAPYILSGIIAVYLLWVVALYTLVIPLLMMAVLRSLGRLSNFSATERRERLLPLAIGTVCYLLCALNLSKVPSAGLLGRFMVAAACCEAVSTG